MRPVRTPSAMSSTRSAHIARHWPDAQRVAGAQRVDAVPEEHLGAVDVADAGQHLLVHQQVADRARAARDPPPRQVGVGVAAQRVGPEPAEDLVAPGRADEVAQDRAAQVGVRRPARVGVAARPPAGGVRPRPARAPRRPRRARRTTPIRPRWTWTKRSWSRSTKRCLPAESAPTTVAAVELRRPRRRSVPAARRRGRRARRTPRPGRRRAGGGCGPQASVTRVRAAQGGLRQRRELAGLVVDRELADAPGVALVAGERRGEEDLDEAGHVLHRVHPAADRDHVGVVVLAGEGRPSPPTRPARSGCRSPCWPRSARRCPSRR